MHLTEEQIERYSRHILLPEVGGRGQERLLASSAFVVGAGGLGTLQATEALKLLLGIGEPFSHRLLVYDALAGEFRTVRRERDPACPLCGERPTLTELVAVAQAECCPGGRCDSRAGREQGTTE